MRWWRRKAFLWLVGNAFVCQAKRLLAYERIGWWVPRASCINMPTWMVCMSWCTDLEFRGSLCRRRRRRRHCCRIIASRSSSGCHRRLAMKDLPMVCPAVAEGMNSIVRRQPAHPQQTHKHTAAGKTRR